MKDTMCGLVKEVNAPSGLVYHTDLSIPEINDDEVLIKVHCSAICGTDLHIMEWDEWSQKRIKAPVTVGHETAGEIVAVGKNVTERKVGDRVSCESHIPCGECYFCKNGMPHICKNVKLFGCTQNGAFAEYAKIRWDCTFLLEDDVTDEAACMFEPMGAGIHGVEAAEVNGKTVLVSGCGPIGLTAISASKTFGAVKVIACDLIDEKLEVAKKMGADAVLNSAKCDLPAEVRTLTGGVGVDAAIDITGAEPAIAAAHPAAGVTDAEIVAAAPVTVNMMLLKTTCPIISTSTASIALSPLVNSAEISRPMQLDENIVSKTVIKISISVSSSRWFCGTCTMETKPKARIAACKTSTSSSTAALLSTTAGRLTPTDASRRMISRSLQISR